jgi:hypothetical protein
MTALREDFDDWLDHELRRVLVHIEGPSPDPVQAAYASLGARRTARAIRVTIVAAAVLAALVIGSSAAVATATRSPNPSTWGRTVVRAVHDCGPEAGAGTAEVTRCVTAVARKEGQERTGPGASGSPPPEAHDAPATGGGAGGQGQHPRPGDGASASQPRGHDASRGDGDPAHGSKPEGAKPEGAKPGSGSEAPTVKEPNARYGPAMTSGNGSAAERGGAGTSQTGQDQGGRASSNGQPAPAATGQDRQAARQSGGPTRGQVQPTSEPARSRADDASTGHPRGT